MVTAHLLYFAQFVLLELLDVEFLDLLLVLVPAPPLAPAGAEDADGSEDENGEDDVQGEFVLLAELGFVAGPGFDDLHGVVVVEVLLELPQVAAAVLHALGVVLAELHVVPHVAAWDPSDWIKLLAVLAINSVLFFGLFFVLFY